MDIVEFFYEIASILDDYRAGYYSSEEAKGMIETANKNAEKDSLGVSEDSDAILSKVEVDSENVDEDDDWDYEDDEDSY